MFKPRLVFNLVGERSLVERASLEMKQYLGSIYGIDTDILVADKDTIFDKHNISLSNIYKQKQFYINKVYVDPKNINKDADRVTELSRHIRNSTHSMVHPYNFHVEEAEDKYVSDFMNKCGQINCVYPLLASDKEKKRLLEVFLE